MHVQAAGDEDLLLAELREAFGLGTHGLRRGARRPREAGEGGSSACSLADEAESLAVGSRMGDFEILGELGRGGMGIVFRARQLSLNRQVALKILPGAMWRGGEAVIRFRREAQAAARLNHANVVPIYAQGEHEDSYYYAMKLVEGVSLDTVLKSHPELLSSAFPYQSTLTETRSKARVTGSRRQALGKTSAEPRDRERGAGSGTAIRRTLEDFRHISRMMADVADGLAHAHENGVIHRDIKPHNLILGMEQRVYITDFGLAYLTNEPHLTVSGEIMGTPSYLAPEQVRGDVGTIDHRADIYSVGVTLYELTTGQRPFAGETRDQILRAICSEFAVAPRRLDSRIPADLETICLRAMEKDTSQRYPTAGALAEDLRRFAEGRLILSRRVSPLVKGARWVRRHKAVTAALVAIAALGVVSAAWAVSAAGAQKREASSLLQSVYSGLVHRGYQRPELVATNIERAGALGGETIELKLVRALACLRATDQVGAIEDVEAVLAEEPANIQAWYILAWARWRDGDRGGSREAFAHAEHLGGPQTAEDWYFRGLATHFDDVTVAIESYRNASIWGTINGAFFPQATLHLARAHNQHMYATRTIDALAEAESSLQRLIENQQYGAFPYYLLSITYRLAGEIYSGSSGVRGDNRADDYFAKALYWAREGQQIDPRSDRPVTAEAECLEQMGLWHEAIDARNRALELAATEGARCEGYHYRWRLHYWVGNLEEALDDIRAHRGCMPHSPFYAHVYPALVYAELGDMDQALTEARALVADSPNDTLMALWSGTTLRLLGAPEEAEELLLDRMDSVDFEVNGSFEEIEGWLDALYAFCAGQATFAVLEELADEAEKPWRLRGEADFHAGAKALGEGRRAEAMERFARSYRSFDGALNYTFHSRVIFEKLREDPEWPSWKTSTPVGNETQPVGAQNEGGVAQ